MIRFNKEIDCGYCAGLALAVPIYNEFFSWYVSVILALPLLFFLVRREFVVRKPAEALIPFGLLFLFYGLALLLDPSVYAVYVAKELIIALCLFLIYLVSNEGSLNGFFDAVTPVGFVSALIGLVKAALLDRGYLLGFVLDFCGYYPAGSGLCLNYNNLGLLWLVACLGFLNRGLWCWAPVVIAAGALVGSRRFLILMCFIPVVWFYLRQSFRISRAIIFILSSFLIIDFVSFPDSFERFRFGGEEYKVIFSFGDKGGGGSRWS